MACHIYCNDDIHRSSIRLAVFKFVVLVYVSEEEAEPVGGIGANEFWLADHWPPSSVLATSRDPVRYLRLFHLWAQKYSLC